MTIKQRRAEIIKLLARYYPNPECALIHSNPEELLIATILSAQCTDARVNIVTEKLFKKYKTPEDFAKADLKELEQDVKPTGFYKNKAKNIKSCCQDLVSKFNSKAPKNLEDLVSLAGVGRKTANVVLGNAYGIASGVVVDTHVKRLSNRLGFVKETTPEKIELKLNKLLDKSIWINFSHWLILHGRALCKSRKPQCEKCFLNDLCPKKI
ncbi:endonuclease III [bacterium]|nr:endonuclease III [bacterium]